MKVISHLEIQNKLFGHGQGSPFTHSFQNLDIESCFTIHWQWKERRKDFCLFWRE